MSMPSFPPCGADMTREEALTMIIASIAMEELALSHILNAEGEKLQYVLGTLTKGQKGCASTQEVLAVNKSVNGLLDTVMQSEMLLKGKLEKVLEAGGCPPVPGPPCSCGPRPDPGPPCSCGPGPAPVPPWSGGPCRPKSAVWLTGWREGFCWEKGSPLRWKCREQRGSGIRWNADRPAQIELDPKRAYAISCVINVQDLCPHGGAGAVLVSLEPRHGFSSVPPLYFSVKNQGCAPLTLHYAAAVFPRECPAPCASLSLVLDYKDQLFVDQASLSVVEI